MSIVYIPQEPRKRDDDGGWKPLYDLTPAVRFGSLEILLPHGPMLLDTGVVMAELKEKLKHFTVDDFIMLIGDPSAIAATVLVASQISGGNIKVLKYDRAERQYNSVKLKF